MFLQHLAKLFLYEQGFETGVPHFKAIYFSLFDKYFNKFFTIIFLRPQGTTSINETSQKVFSRYEKIALENFKCDFHTEGK